jgi:hypothetical protein
MALFKRRLLCNSMPEIRSLSWSDHCRLSLPCVTLYGCVLSLALVASPVMAESDSDPAIAASSAAASAAAPVTVPVISVTSLDTSAQQQSKQCTPVLMTQRQYELAQANSQSWYLRDIRSLTGAPLGAAAGAYFSAYYLSSHIWMLPAALVGGAAGWVMGPFGIILGAGGSILGRALSHDVPVTVGVAGGLIGIALWHFVVPPPKPATPDSPVDVPVEHFVTNEQCGEVQHRTFGADNGYKVDFVLDGHPMSATLPYDPGNTLAVYPDGKPGSASPVISAQP